MAALEYFRRSYLPLTTSTVPDLISMSPSDPESQDVRELFLTTQSELFSVCDCSTDLIISSLYYQVLSWSWNLWDTKHSSLYLSVMYRVLYQIILVNIEWNRIQLVNRWYSVQDTIFFKWPFLLILPYFEVKSHNLSKSDFADYWN